MGYLDSAFSGLESDLDSDRDSDLESDLGMGFPFAGSVFQPAIHRDLCGPCVLDGRGLSHTPATELDGSHYRHCSVFVWEHVSLLIGNVQGENLEKIL